MRLTKAYFLLCLLFVFSVVLRLPNLNRPLSKHHEFNTAFFLIPMEIWADDGADAHGFLPPYNYSTNADQNIPEPICIPFGEKKGTFYYLSFPALSYLAPYYTFKSLGLSFTPWNLQVYNLTLHFLLIVLVFSALIPLFSYRSSLVSTVLYLFAPGPMWYHGNGYTHHVFALIMLGSAVYFFFEFLKSEKYAKWHVLGFSVSALFLVLSEWIGFLFLFFIVLICLRYFKIKRFQWLAFGAVISGSTGLVLLLYQYHNFIGLENYIGYLENRLTLRSGIGAENHSLLYPLWRWIYWTLTSYGAWILFLLLGLFVVLRKKTKFHKATHYEKIAFLSLVLPMVLFHLVFSEFTAVHEYSVLYNGLIWAFLTAWLLDKMDWKSFATRPWMRFVLRKSSSLIVLPIVLLSVFQYYVINRPGETAQNGDRYDQLLVIGQKIRETAQPDERVFLLIQDGSLDFVNPQINYYAKRNFKPVRSHNDIQKFMSEYGGQKAIVFRIENGKIVLVERLEFV